MSRSITIQGHEFKLLEIISLKKSEDLYDMSEVHNAERVSDGRPVIVKLRYQLSSHPREVPSDVPIIIEDGKRDFRSECRSLQDNQMLGVPVYLGHQELIQRDEHFRYLPEGYMNALAMDKVPGEPVTYLRLTATEADLIKKQLARIFDKMRRKAYDVGSPNTEHVFFDRETQQTYFIGMSGVGKDDYVGLDPIVKTSKKVTMFCVDSFVIRR
ncbi:hypothetical protein BDV38DRAFT_280604 [Aspergillus pseudotamarii]|uniref:Uncharacterized protein n=1 Tax=Aspergillus pseudotamarii TaxID=132259 RepID=A0A5N6T1A1_ASPPS|nr:uncharacterized protein BDV38DRAFT_280604 [Aspergillus pseudotamarii]KAE8140140.1 hypothetical protein BDV38DRAFT_280604 [Aspergillus pseudotamarii]